ncbi:MAG: hypothetical protein EOP93_05245 [Lysobacteraceae bacterium]|nr:MAG: hypothetical protein EOP93_05245 [Xanthomonadaceae bacterium]
MTRHPRQPLDAEERALAAMLPRAHGRSEPGPDLDARILAAAQSAVQSQPASRRRHRSWIAPTALAASLMLAVGLAWQLRPPASLRADAPAGPATPASPDAGSDALMVQAIESPPATPPAEAVIAQPRPRPAQPPLAEAAPLERRASAAAEAAIEPEIAAPPPPAPPPPVVFDQGAAAPQSAPPMAEAARAAPPAMAKARAAEAAKEHGSAAGNAAAAEDRDQARMAAEAATLDTIMADDPGEEVPPATADSPEVREAWLRRIGELLKQGKTDDAKASLAEFRRRYPDATLPLELRKLEP